MIQLTTFFFVLIVAFSLGSCEDYKGKFEEERQQQRLYTEKISVLEEEERLIKGEYADAIETINAIDETLNDIATRNKEVDALFRKKALTNNSAEQQAITAKIKALKELNQTSNERIRSLKSKAKSFKIENSQLKKIIERLDTRFELLEDSVQKAQTTVGNMQIALSQLEAEVASTETDLTSAYANLKVETAKLERSNQDLKVTLTELQNKTDFIEDDAKAYVVCGNKSSLRKNEILRLLSSKRLTLQFRRQVKELGTAFDYFNNLEVDCGDKNIEYILPERPSNAYKIENNRLIITNKNEFWATSKTVVLITK